MTSIEDASTTPSAPPPLPPGDVLPEPTNIITTLLKAPQTVAGAIASGKNLLKPSLVLLLTALVCHAVFGLAIGMFGGWTVAAMDVAKGPLIALCSLLLCFPSLYVFACVSGSPISIPQTFALGCACLAMNGLLLVGLAPVAWLFSVSTESAPFVVVLSVFIWFIAISFASRFVSKLRTVAVFQRQAGIKLWFFILILVTLQMVTCMRPMLTKSKGHWWPTEKKFFLSHFGSTFLDED